MRAKNPRLLICELMSQTLRVASLHEFLDSSQRDRYKKRAVKKTMVVDLRVEPTKFASCRSYGVRDKLSALRCPGLGNGWEHIAFPSDPLAATPR
jgi:hypothetical protein